MLLPGVGFINKGKVFHPQLVILKRNAAEAKLTAKCLKKIAKPGTQLIRRKKGEMGDLIEGLVSKRMIPFAIQDRIGQPLRQLTHGKWLHLLGGWGRCDENNRGGGGELQIAV